MLISLGKKQHYNALKKIALIEKSKCWLGIGRQVGYVLNEKKSTCD